MIKKLGLLGISLVSTVVLVVFGTLLLHYLDREAVYNPPPFKPAHAPEVLKDSADIVIAMKELATEAPVHPLKSGAKGERAVFQRNQYYLPSNKARSWETALRDVRLGSYALSSKEAFIQVVSNGIPGTDHPGVSGLTSSEWDSAYAQAKALAAAR
jgi:hypothetical protein